MYNDESMKKPKQLSFLKEPRPNTKLWWIQKQYNYGGALDYRKVERPFDSKKLVHVVFKAKVGNGIWFTRSRSSIEKLLKKIARRYGVAIKNFAINKDHIHVLLWTKTKESLTRFLRLFAAEMGRKYKTVYKRFGLKKPAKFWVHRPFTRLVSWGRKSLKTAEDYIQQNRKEALGFIAYKSRNHRLSRFLTKWETAMRTLNTG